MKIKKRTNNHERGKLGHHMLGETWDRITADFLWTITLNDSGNKYIIVTTDYFSKCLDLAQNF